MFRINVWDPGYIVLQMICLQALLYLVLGLFVVPLVGWSGSRLTLGLMFDPERFDLGWSSGWIALPAMMLSGPVMGYLMSYVVERAKKVLDFTVTCYGFHFIATVVVNGGHLPTVFAWWVAVLGAGAIACVTGEWFCMKREMREIPVGPSSENAALFRPG